MMNLFGEILRSLRATRYGPLTLAWLSPLILLALLVFFLLVWSGLGEDEEGELLALLDPQLTPRQIDRLYLEVREWEESAQVEFIFEEEVAAGLVRLAVKLPSANLFRIFLHNPREAQAVQERLSSLAGIGRVIVCKQGSLRDLLRSTAGMRTGMIALLVVLGLLAVVSIRSAIRSLIYNWRGELRLLHLSGVGHREMGTPFFLLASLMGLVGGVVVTLGLYTIHIWGLDHPQTLYRSLPPLLDSAVILPLALLALGIGLGLGFLGGAWSLATLRRMLRS